MFSRIRRTTLAALAATTTSAGLAPQALAHGGTAPAGGAPLDQVALATAIIAGGLGALIILLALHRAGRRTPIGWGADLAQRASGLPGWASLPSLIAAAALGLALVGVYWDISLHVDEGRDEGPLANPAHYLIILGLFGVFAAGLLAIALPARGVRPGPSAVLITPDWYAPAGGVLIAVCGGMALLVGFPLDDVWHRLFGQDVTLWGPTHLVMIGGAVMCLVGQAVLITEGVRARPTRAPRAKAPLAARVPGAVLVRLRKVGLVGGLLLGMEVLLAEFDFGIPQYRLVFHPMLLALFAGIALVAGRLWIGRGGAFGVLTFYLVVRAAVSAFVGPLMGETTPAFPLFAVEALAVELVALALGTGRPLFLGAASGALIGTAGFAAEWAWSAVVMPIPWTVDILPEGVAMATVAGVAGGILGGLLGAGLRGELPRPATARVAFAGSLVAIAALIANGLATTAPDDARATVKLSDVPGEGGREALAEVRLSPPGLADDASWMSAIAWQGGGTLVLDHLEETGPGLWRSQEPLPLHGGWKSAIRLHDGRDLAGIPVYMGADPAIPAPEIPAPTRFTRELQPDREILQRERKRGVPGALWGGASAAVAALFLVLALALGWGVGRIGRPEAPPGRPRERRFAETVRPAGSGAVGARS